MSRYLVHAHAVHVHELFVEASSPEEAKQKALSGEVVEFGGEELLNFLDNTEEWAVDELV